MSELAKGRGGAHAARALSCLTLAALALCACPQPLSPCETTSECLDTEVCVEDLCRRVCNTATDCAEAETCRAGACMPGPAVSLRDAATGDATTRDAAAGDAPESDANLGDANPGDAAAGDVAAGDVSAGDGAGPDVLAPDSAVADVTTGDASIADASAPDTWFPNLPAGWLHPNWKQRLRFTVDASAINDNLYDVPVLLRLDPSFFDYGTVHPTGADLRFADDDGNLLPHEIELWQPGGVSVVWVKLLEVTGETADDSLWLFVGNPNASDRQDPASVWINGYQGVWHLDASLKEASGTESPGTAYGALEAEGWIGVGQSLDGVDYIQLAQHSDIGRDASAMTVSAWIRPLAMYSYNYILSISTGSDPPTTASRLAFGLVQGDDLGLYGRAPDDAAFDAVETSQRVLRNDVWQYAAGVADYAGDQMLLYLDGNLEEQASVTFPAQATDDSPTTSVVMGAQDDASGGFFRGTLDELRVASVARSADWIKFQHLSMTDGVLSFVAQERINVADVGGPPVAVNDVVVTEEDQAIVIDVLFNDSDPDNDPIRIETVSDGARGSVTAQTDGTLVYRPYLDENGDDLFAYTISDGISGESSATVSVSVRAVPEAPRVADDVVYVPLFVSAIIEVLANDVEPDGEAMSVVGVGPAIYGTTQRLSDWEVAYTSDPVYLGHDSFTYTVEDSTGRQSVGTVWVTVFPGEPQFGFVDASVPSGLDDDGSSYGLAWADYDRDGDLDVWIGGSGRLMRNDGQGAFTLARTLTGARGGAWADPDNDGDLDLFTAYDGHLYVNAGLADQATSANLVGANVGTAVWFEYDRDGSIDLMLPNGEAPWAEVRRNSGNAPLDFEVLDGASMGLISDDNGETSTAADFDDDGDMDLWITGWGGGRLFENDGMGAFADVTTAAGIATSYTFPYVGVAFGDCDNDGDLDLFVGHDGARHDQLYINDGDGTFTMSSEFGASTTDSKGVAWGDIDNDGDLDLAVANGDGPNALYLNLGACSFLDVAPVYGVDGGDLPTTSVSLVDVDRDGDLDLYAANNGSANQLWINSLDDTNFLKVIVRGGGMNQASRDGIGSRVELRDADSGDVLAVREISGGDGMGSQVLAPVHFGLAQSWGGSDVGYGLVVRFSDNSSLGQSIAAPSNLSVTIGSNELKNTLEVDQAP